MKLVSCNIESHSHLEDRVIPFLQKEEPDVVCLQEVFRVDVPRLQEVLGMEVAYAGMANVTEVSKHQTDALGEWGVALFTHLESSQFQTHYYVRKEDDLPVFFENEDPNSMHRAVVAVTGQHQGHEYTIATTHFTWSTEGQFTQEQHQAYFQMKQILDTLPPHVICGDFNSPRIWLDQAKTEYEPNVFGKLAETYQDNIPKDVQTTIDGSLHKAGNLQLTVDGLFSHANYQVEKVKVVDEISDHKALVAEIKALS